MEDVIARDGAEARRPRRSRPRAVIFQACRIRVRGQAVAEIESLPSFPRIEAQGSGPIVCMPRRRFLDIPP